MVPESHDASLLSLLSELRLWLSSPDEVAERLPFLPLAQGGFATQAQASRAWMLRMSEWVTQPLAGTPSALFKGNQYKAGGLRTGASAAHILVYNRCACWLAGWTCWLAGLLACLLGLGVLKDSGMC